MRRTIIILACVLLFVSGLPLSAWGRFGHRGHGHHFGRADAPGWQASGSHPSWSGWRGWGRHNPRCNPDQDPAEDPATPPGDPQEDPGDKPGPNPGEDPGDGPSEDPGEKGLLSLEQMLPLDPFTGSFPG